MLLQKIADVENRLSDKVNEVENKLFEKLQEHEWSDCQPQCDQFLEKFESQLSKLESNTVCIEGIQKLQQKIEDKVDAIQSNTDKIEEEEVRQRQTNLIIHGVAESESEEISQRVEDDLLQVATMLQELNVEGVMVEKVIRLGKKPEGDSTKSLKVKTDEGCSGHS